jgi:hypothetical protein
MKIKPWTIALGVLFILDSIHTIIIGSEANTIILWTMSTFGLTLDQAMGVRLLYLLPLLLFLNTQDQKFSIFTFFAYIGVYILLTGGQFFV